jgi:DinB superfamily
MHTTKWLLAAFVVFGSCLAFAQAKSEGHPTVAKELNSAVSDVEGEFVLTADAMPEDKYGYAPTAGEFKGVRTFALQVKHVATVNYMIGAAILVEKPPIEVGSGNGPDSLTSKADIMKFLKDSFAYVHKAVGSVNEKNMLEPIPNPFGEGMTTRLYMSVLAPGHCFDHYGQMIEYLRSNGIVPPASR